MPRAKPKPGAARLPAPQPQNPDTATVTRREFVTTLAAFGAVMATPKIARAKTKGGLRKWVVSLDHARLDEWCTPGVTYLHNCIFPAQAMMGFSKSRETMIAEINAATKKAEPAVCVRLACAYTWLADSKNLDPFFAERILLIRAIDDIQSGQVEYAEPPKIVTDGTDEYELDSRFPIRKALKEVYALAKSGNVTDAIMRAAYIQTWPDEYAGIRHKREGGNGDAAKA